MTMNIFVSKETRLNIRIKPEFKADLEAAAEFHGLTVTSYVHSILVKKIREEKEKEPEAFIDVSKRQTIPVMKQAAGENDNRKKS